MDGTDWDFCAHQPTSCMSQCDVRPMTNSSPLDIGTMALETWSPGAVGKVATYDYLLTPAQMANHYRSMTGSEPSGLCSDECTIPPTP